MGKKWKRWTFLYMEQPTMRGEIDQIQQKIKVDTMICNLELLLGRNCYLSCYEHCRQAAMNSAVASEEESYSS
jgi:hypothetical protein